MFREGNIEGYLSGKARVELLEILGQRQYQRGVGFLLKTQLDDGSWHVRSRSKPFQLYFESGFPHGKDQFISVAASGWATTALALPPSLVATLKTSVTTCPALSWFRAPVVP